MGLEEAEEVKEVEDEEAPRMSFQRYDSRRPEFDGSIRAIAEIEYEVDCPIFVIASGFNVHGRCVQRQDRFILLIEILDRVGIKNIAQFYLRTHNAFCLRTIAEEINLSDAILGFLVKPEDQ
jgi:hypothetical protein